MGISLEKRAEKVGIILAKRGITKVPAVRVGAVYDVSGSAQGFYQSGVMQETSERLMGVAMKFDDNGELDVWSFSNNYAQAPVATKDSYATYINEQFLTDRQVNHTLWGGTSYAPVLEGVIEYYFPSAPKATGFFGSLFGKKSNGGGSGGAPLPAMALFITDGANDDQPAAARVLRQAKDQPIYFMMVGVGSEHNFRFLQEMADELPNVGFVNLNNLSITDEALYEQLVSGEFAAWVKQYAN